MKIGIAVGDLLGPAPLDTFVEQVRTAAAAGLAAAWSAQALGWDALTALAVAGTREPGIALGTSVVPTPQRHPLVLASQALTVQAATGGRLTLGVGAGVGLMTEGMYGFPAARPARRMREYLSVLRPLLDGEEVAYRGETVTAAGAVAVPAVPAPPVLLAALGPAMLRVAGELADGTVTWMTGPRTLGDHIVPTIGKAAEAAGRPAPRVVAGLLVCLTQEPDRARVRIAEQFALAGQVPEYRAVLDREGVSGPQDVALVGTEESLGRSLHRLADVGVTDFVAAPFGDAAERERTTEFLGWAARQA